jgi:glycogen synthase
MCFRTTPSPCIRARGIAVEVRTRRKHAWPDWSGKRENANFIRKQFNLALSRGPLFGLIARLVHQKGVDLVLNAAKTILESGGQIVVMGQGDPALERALMALQEREPEISRGCAAFQRRGCPAYLCRQ